MDKIERHKLFLTGITILRSQFNQKNNCWKIVQYNGGGWAKYGLMWFGTKELCDRWIISLVKPSKGKIKADE